MKAEPCTRSLLEQWADRSGARRRGDHASLVRLDLLSDHELDTFRNRHADRASAAMDAVVLLAEAMDLRLAAVEEAARQALEDHIPERPTLGIVACLDCCAHEVARVVRPWAIDRAMRRTGLAERDVRSILAVLAEAHGDHAPERLDRLTTMQLRELHAIVGHDFDPETLRQTFATDSNARVTESQ